MASKRKNYLTAAYSDDHNNRESIFDLRAEYRFLNVRLSRIANEHNRSLAMSFAPDTPRYFVGFPEKFRELIFAMVENFIINENVEIITVTIDSKPLPLHQRHQLRITTVAMGHHSLRQQTALLERPTSRPQIRPYIKQQHTMFRINRLLQAMDGSLQTTKVNKGIQYVAHLFMTKSNSDSVFLWC